MKIDKNKISVSPFNKIDYPRKRDPAKYINRVFCAAAFISAKSSIVRKKLHR